jgi:type II secretion system protein N
MVKRILVGVVVVGVLGIVGLFVWARIVFGADTVRSALSAQMSSAIGQPVTVGAISAGLYPRVTVRLKEVAIGNPPRILVQELDLATDFRALLSRRIEQASMRLNGARIELPLPPLDFTSSSEPDAKAAGAPVELVSIDEVVLNGVEIISGGRTVRGDIELVPHGNAVTVKKVALSADDTTLTATGEITDLSGPIGELHVKAGALDVDKLLAFANAFAGGTGMTGSTAPPGRSQPLETSSARRPAGGGMNLTVSLEADGAKLGAMHVDKLTGQAHVKNDEVTLDPLAFGLFGGRYDGTIRVSVRDEVPTFRWKAAIAGVDAGAAAAFAGTPDTVSGRLSGQIDLAGRGADATTAMKTVRGSARLDLTNGIVKNLGLVRTIVAAMSLNSDAVKRAAGGSRDEPFTRLGATMAIGNGAATTHNLRFESDDLTLTGDGTARLDGSALNFKGLVQLSEELSKQAGASVMRVSQDNGRVTLPAVISGSASAPQVRVDTANLAKRALRNAITEQGDKLLKGGFGGLIRR